MSQNLDRAKPLWEIWVVEGLDDNRWALLSKVHHCMVDGVASTDLMAVLFDAEREPTGAPPPDDWRARTVAERRRVCSRDALVTGSRATLRRDRGVARGRRQGAARVRWR